MLHSYRVLLNLRPKKCIRPSWMWQIIWCVHIWEAVNFLNVKPWHLPPTPPTEGPNRKEPCRNSSQDTSQLPNSPSVSLSVFSILAAQLLSGQLIKHWSTEILQIPQAAQPLLKLSTSKKNILTSRNQRDLIAPEACCCLLTTYDLF